MLDYINKGTHQRWHHRNGGLWEVGVYGCRGCVGRYIVCYGVVGMAPTHGILTKKKHVSPTAVGGLGKSGEVPVGGGKGVRKTGFA